jgi:hypothetical protein
MTPLCEIRDRHLAVDLCRILLFRNASEILLAGGSRLVELPVVEVSPGERWTPSLNAEVRRQFQLAAYCLFRPCLPAAEMGEQGVFFQLMVSLSAQAKAPKDMQWVSLSSLTEKSWAGKSEFAVVRAALDQLQRYRSEAEFAPFGRIGWLEELRCWIEQNTSSSGLTLTAEMHQLNASPHFSLLRFETNCGALWFKATGAPNAHESWVSETLFRLFPSFVPEILAMHRPWNGWLTREAGGVLLESDPNPSSWTLAAAHLAKLQTTSLNRDEELLSAGVKDVRTLALRRQIHPFLATMKELMAQQPKSSPRPLEGGELDSLGDQIEPALDDLDRLRIPNGLGHLDLNPGNILVASEHCVFLDWAEACVGNPFLTFEYLRAHYERAGADSKAKSCLIAAYCEHWERVLPAGAVQQSLRLARIVAVFAFAVSSLPWRNAADSAAYLRSLVRRMYREANHSDRSVHAVLG